MDSESPKTQTLALPLPPLPPLPPRRYAPPLERKEILKKHGEWLESNGEMSLGERTFRVKEVVELIERDLLR